MKPDSPTEHVTGLRGSLKAELDGWIALAGYQAELLALAVAGNK